MKYVVAALVLLFLALQYELWFDKGGLLTTFELKKSISKQKLVNEKLKQRNNVLIADIRELKKGNQAVEERARNDLGMVKKGEVFYQVVQP